MVCDIELNLPFSFRSTEAPEESYCIFIIIVSYKFYVYAEMKENSILEKKTLTVLNKFNYKANNYYI